MAAKYFTKNCPGCGLPFTRPINKLWQRCCSGKCAQTLRHGPPHKRFFEKVQKTDTCWLWTAVKNLYGYGNFTLHNKLVLAHRFSWEHHNGPIPAGLCVLHRCDVRHCVNPAHLFIGTQSENVADMRAKGRQAIVVGEDHGLSKLTETQVVAIRADSRFQTVIAKQYGVAPSTIARVQSLEGWKHV